MDRLKSIFTGCADALRQSLKRFPGRTDSSSSSSRRRRRPDDAAVADDDENDEDDEDNSDEDDDELVIEVDEHERWDEDRGWSARNLRPKGGDPARYTSGGNVSSHTFPTPPLAVGWEYTGKWRVDVDVEGASPPLTSLPRQVSGAHALRAYLPDCRSQAPRTTAGCTA